MQIGLLGYGTVGKAFYALTEEQPGLTCRALLTRRPRGTGALETDAFAAILNDPSIDTVVELIGGIHPAYDYIAAALRTKKNVVTANKAVVCAYYPELIRLATENGVCLRCTAAAGGGIPWLCSLGRAARMDRITAVEGILNGTTNYIVSEMTARSAGYGELLKEAQRLGYAEADPTDDVEGYDARRKLVLSADLAFDTVLKEDEVPCVGISHLNVMDIAWARERGLVWKLNARAERKDAAVSAFVCPTLFPINTPEAHTNGSRNLVSLYAKRIGKQSFSGAGAGGYPTASNVLADCMEIAQGAAPFYSDRPVSPLPVDNTDGVRTWLFRSYGRYTVREETAADAFEAYRAALEGDRRSLLAYLPFGML
ncbi:MAG: homoserine dehydrogenase [Clostridia bacterium]|nr:homoserine dehydrogenase [Clostridia bacterium]